MKLLSVALAAASLAVLNLAQAGNSISFVACKTKDFLCHQNTCEYQHIFAVSPNVWKEYFTPKLYMPPYGSVTDTECAPSGVWCVKHDKDNEETSVQYAHKWHNYKKSDAAKTYSRFNGVYDCQEYWDEY
ncbi:hypothetical protein BG005_002125 [Podila minutissima]|nr:hypothetical protein BG005_002125 [Podila minutissima]